MGIKHLNRYLLDECSESSIRKVHFAEFSNQIIIVDTSIYLYKFLEKEALLEYMYLLISIFRNYNITPIFVFDGKPPPEKKDILEQRKIDKKSAEEKFLSIQKQVKEGEHTEQAINDMHAEMDELKKKFIRVKDADIHIAKELMDAYGIIYFESKGEADQLCAYLVKHNYAWACMSDDMDMFLYGCPRVLRHLSIVHHTVILYDTMRILKDLHMNLKTFKDILILSGTDYNMTEHTSLFETLKWYSQYSKDRHNGEVTFYDWLCRNTKYIHNRTLLDKVHNMFDLSMFSLNNSEEIKKIINRLPFRIGKIDKPKLLDIMREDGFIFV